MKIRDISSQCVAECTEDAPLSEVFDLIQKCEHGLVVVLDSPTHRVPLGVVSEHTICERLIAGGRRPKELQAGSVMDTRARRVPASTDVASCGELLRSGSSAILLVDENRQFCGMVTREALASAYRRTTAPPVFAPAAAIPAKAEIPAFGWLR